MIKAITLLAATVAAYPSPSESYNPSGQSPAPAAPSPPPSSGGYSGGDNGGVSDYVSQDCGKPVAPILVDAATALTDACSKYGGLSQVKGAVQGLLQSIPYSRCSLSCMGMKSERDDKQAVDVLVGHSEKVCASDYVGAGRTGSYLCVLSCNFDGDYKPVAPQPEEPDYQQPAPGPEPEPKPSEPDYQPAPEPPKPSQPAGGDYGGGWEDQCIAKTNDYRRSVGLPALTRSGTADGICYKQADCMAAKHNLSHDACGGLGSRLSQGGAGGGAGAENIAWNVLDAIKVVDKWWQSPGHHKNIINPKVTAMACCITGEYSAQVFIQEGGSDYGYGY